MFLVCGDELIEKEGETLTIECRVVIWVVCIGVFAFTVAGKVEIIFFWTILKFTNQIGKLSIVVYEMFSDSFERSQSKKLLVESLNHFLMIFASDNTFLSLLVELDHVVHNSFYSHICRFIFFLIHYYFFFNSPTLLLHYIIIILSL